MIVFLQKHMFVFGMIFDKSAAIKEKSTPYHQREIMTLLKDLRVIAIAPAISPLLNEKMFHWVFQSIYWENLTKNCITLFYCAA
jgi:hypothetical protein